MYLLRRRADDAAVGTSGWIAAGALAGVPAGAAGAALLRRLRRGTTMPCWTAALAVAALWAVVGARAGQLPMWWWPVPLALGWLAVLLTATDLRARRLPDALTVPAYPVAGVLLALAATGAADPGMALRAVLGAVLWAGGYAAVRLVAPTALGAGDVKLAGLLGAVTAAVSWPGLLLAVLAATLLTAVLAAGAAAWGHRDVPHGPAMLAASWLLVLAGPP